MTSPQGTVFLVDDDAAIRSSLSRSLTKRGFVVEDFAAATDFLDSYDPESPGCLVLDYGMPGMNGLELQQKLLAIGYQIPIIFITGHGGVAESVQAIKSGAIDFLEKPFRQAVLIDCIQSAFDLDATLRAQNQAKRRAQASFNALTDREQEIARLMVSDPSNASSKQIARTLEISPRTVDHHRARILEKMQVGSVAELIDLANKADVFVAETD